MDSILKPNLEEINCGKFVDAYISDDIINFINSHKKGNKITEVTFFVKLSLEDLRNILIHCNDTEKKKIIGLINNYLNK